MDYEVPLDDVRRRVAALLSAHLDGGRTLGPHDLAETILIRNGVYCGRRFTHEDLVAVWFAEEAEIKVYAPGHRVQRISLDETGTRMPLAA